MDDFLRYFLWHIIGRIGIEIKMKYYLGLKMIKIRLVKNYFNPDDFLKELRKSTDQFVKFRNGNDIEGKKEITTILFLH